MSSGTARISFAHKGMEKKAGGAQEPRSVLENALGWRQRGGRGGMGESIVVVVVIICGV